MSSNDKTELMLVLHRDDPSDRFIVVSESGQGRGTTRLPRSQIEYEPTGKFHETGIGTPKLAIIKVTLPEWLAEDRGFA